MAHSSSCVCKWTLPVFFCLEQVIKFQWRSVLLVEETRVPGENNWPVASHWQTLSDNVVSPEQGSNSQR